MIRHSIDSQKNILYVKLSGILTPLVIKHSLPKLRDELNKLSDGFILISDISEVTDFDPENYFQLRKSHQLLQTKNPARIIRIVGSARDIFFGFARFDNENGIRNIEFVPDYHTAMRLVDELRSPDKVTA